MDLKQLLDPKARHIFLSAANLAYVYPIVHIKENYLYFSSDKPIPQSFDRGHFLAQDAAGIVQFSNPSVESTKKDRQNTLGLILHRINFDTLDYTITNRRQSMRYELNEFIPISFNVFGENIPAQLINISDSGLRMRVDTLLKTNILCQFHIKLPTQENEIQINTNGLVIYADCEEGSKNIMVGISFVTPDFKTDEDKQKYLKSKDNLTRFIAQKEHSI